MYRLVITCALAALVAVPAAQAGAPKPEHPCYEVAACKTEASRKEFSACIKANEAEAKANEGCAKFRADKDTWLKEKGLSSVDDLFES